MFGSTKKVDTPMTGAHIEVSSAETKDVKGQHSLSQERDHGQYLRVDETSG